MRCLKVLMGSIYSSLIMWLMLLALVGAAPISSNPYYDYYKEFKDVPNDILRESISCFGQTAMRATNDNLVNSKRTVDFGLARGYSGAQEAKHRMGLAAANFPSGPGRRRRSESQIFPIPN